jgi:hypothetical protein
MPGKVDTDLIDGGFMARFLSADETAELERDIDHLIDTLGEEHFYYGHLVQAYHSFEPESNTAATVAELANVIEVVDAALAGRIRSVLSIKIRQSNYPAGWDAASTQAKAQYVLAHPSAGMVAHCVCPGHPPQVAHNVLASAMTIDHVLPVAGHWNTTGRNTDRQTRHQWYWNTANHEYLCGPCNSSRGSGGVYYNVITGTNYSN